ncbi:beta subunit of fatty acid synthetase, partial [Coemansia sp. RSA 1200]
TTAKESTIVSGASTSGDAPASAADNPALLPESKPTVPTESDTLALSDSGNSDNGKGTRVFDDVPPQAIDVVQAIIAQKLKVPMSEIATSKSIKSLAAGTSTLQNELIGDLSKEFSGNLPRKAEELSLQELSTSISSFDGSLGKYTQARIARLFSSKMPGGISLAVARETMQLTYGIGPHRQDSVLLYALASEPSSRLASDTEAKA